MRLLIVVLIVLAILVVGCIYYKYYRKDGFSQNAIIDPLFRTGFLNQPRDIVVRDTKISPLFM